MYRQRAGSNSGMTGLKANRMPNKRLLALEMLLLYVLVPTCFLLPISRFIKSGLVLCAAGYAILLIFRKKLLPRNRFGLNTFKNWKPILARFGAFAALTTACLYLYDKEALFLIVRKNPRLWVIIWFVYCIISVYPQELLLRGFFYARYRDLVANPKLLVILNALFFAYAHNFLSHWLVYLLTFSGGILFSNTYKKSKSLLVVAIEHSLFGLWLFTVGLGGYFAFPTQ